MTKAERETTINFNDEDDFAEICTFQRHIMTKMRKIKDAKKVQDIEMGGRVIGGTWHLPLKCVLLRPIRKKGFKRSLTAQEREDARKRMLLLHEKRKGRDSGEDLKQ